jgi:hypothetical protein
LLPETDRQLFASLSKPFKLYDMKKIFPILALLIMVNSCKGKNKIQEMRATLREEKKEFTLIQNKLSNTNYQDTDLMRKSIRLGRRIDSLEKALREAKEDKEDQEP